MGSYQAALMLVQAIDEDTKPGGRGALWYNRDGQLLETLDEVIRAILANDLDLPKAHKPLVAPALPMILDESKVRRLWFAGQDVAAMFDLSDEQLDAIVMGI